MKTMTSLEAQNRFGELIDTSQREPVMTTGKTGFNPSKKAAPQGVAFFVA